VCFGRAILDVEVTWERSPVQRALDAELLESGRRDTRGGLAPRSVQHARRILLHALRDATEAGLLSPTLAGTNRIAATYRIGKSK
jgi:hypothetical protein